MQSKPHGTRRDANGRNGRVAVPEARRSPARSSARSRTEPARGSSTAAAPASRALDALRVIVNALRQYSHAAEQELGLSGAQLYVLQLLARHPGASINELAEHTLTHQSSVSVVARRLVEHGFASRCAAEGDARRVELRVTAAGRRLLQRAKDAPQMRLIAAVRRLDPTELEPLARGLELLARDVGSERGAVSMFFERKPRGARA